MAITTIGGVIAGDASKEDGGIVKAAFNVSKTNIKFPIATFTPGRYVITAIGFGEPTISTYLGTNITPLPPVYKGDIETKSDTGVTVFDVATTQDGLVVENFDGAITLKTWDQSAVPATLTRPGDTDSWTYENLMSVWNSNDYKVTSPYYGNNILMIGEHHVGDNAIFISEDDGETFKRIRIPTKHTFPYHGAFLYDSNLQEWWISPRGTNYWYKTSHTNLTTADPDKVPWQRIYKMNSTSEERGRVTGGNSGSFLGGVWTGLNEPAPYRNGDSYDQIYKITNDIWFSNLQTQDIIRTGDGGVTWQEFRITATPVSPMTVQPSGHFDYGVFNGSELVQAVRDNGNGHVVRITNFLSGAGPTIQSMDIADSTIYDVDFNNQWTTFTTSRGLYKLQNSTTNLTELTGTYGGSRRWRVAWTGAKWLFFDENARNNFYRTHNVDPFTTFAYDPNAETPVLDGLQNCNMITYTNINQHVDRGDANTQITYTDGSGGTANQFNVPHSYRPWSAITFTKQGGGKRTIFFPNNGEWYDNTYDQVFGHLITDDDGDTWDYKMATYGRYTGTLYSYLIGGTNDQIHFAQGSNAANIDGTGGISFDGGQTWFSWIQYMQYKAWENPNTFWDYWTFKTDYRANSGGGHFYGGYADENGNVVISFYLNGRWGIFESRDDGATWKHWRHNDGFTENDGVGQYQTLNFGLNRIWITEDGTRWGIANNTIYRWKNADFSDLDYMNSNETPDGNERLGDISTTYSGAWELDNGVLIGIGHTSERMVRVNVTAGADQQPKSQYLTIFEPYTTGLAYGNGVWMGVGTYEPQSADYRQGDDGIISYDNGQTWLPIRIPMRARTQTARHETRGGLAFKDGYFIYYGYGWQHFFRTADGFNWDVVETPINDNWRVTDRTYYNSNNPLWKEDPVWRNNEEGFMFSHKNKLYLMSYEGDYFTSTANSELTV